jgi:hypothetical protein
MDFGRATSVDSHHYFPIFLNFVNSMKWDCETRPLMQISGSHVKVRFLGYWVAIEQPKNVCKKKINLIYDCASGH